MTVRRGVEDRNIERQLGGIRLIAGRVFVQQAALVTATEAKIATIIQEDQDV